VSHFSQTTVESFHSRLSVLQSLFDKEEFKEFGAYFRSTYLQTSERIDQWAAFVRICRTVVNTNMFLESWHRFVEMFIFTVLYLCVVFRTLKMKYLNRRMNKRLDELIAILFQAVKDIEHQMLIQVHVHMCNYSKFAYPAATDCMLF